MITRREILQVGAATAALAVGGGLTRVMAQQRVTEAELLKFDALGNVTLLHVADIHGQLMPVHFREPSINLGVGEARGQPPHLTGEDFLKRFGILAKSAAAYALTSEDFVALAKSYGRIGGLDRLAAVLKHVRAERGDKVLFLDGGDTWQGSMGANMSKGQDMVDCMALLKPDAMTGHWEFTYGEARVQELIKSLGFPFLALNVRDTEWNEPVFEPMKMFERGGVKIAVLGQAFPYTPVANPRWMMPKWTFGIREEEVRVNVEKARKSGAQLVVLLSHNGFDVDRKLAARVSGIDVILTSHTHDAIPEAIAVGKTLLIASGSHGKFVSRLDLDVQNGAVKGFRYRLIPLFADAIAPDAEMTAAIAKARAPYAKDLARVVGQAELAAVPARQFQRHLRRRDLRGAAQGARRRDRAVARFSLGHQRATRAADHGGGHPQRHRHHLSAGLPHEYERAAPQGGAGGRGRQSVQSRSLLPAGRRHGALRRARLRH